MKACQTDQILDVGFEVYRDLQMKLELNKNDENSQREIQLKAIQDCLSHDLSKLYSNNLLIGDIHPN